MSPSMRERYAAREHPGRHDHLPAHPAFVRVARGPWLQFDTPSVELGRDAFADVIVPGDEVSRRHATLRWNGAGWTVEDHSRNGIFLDGRRVDRQVIQATCVLRFGGVAGPEVAFAGDPRAKRVEPTGVVRIGRGEGNDLEVDDQLVSRRHACVRSVGDGRYVVTDEGSTNGTYVDGVRVSGPTELADRSLIGVGRHGFRVLGGLVVPEPVPADVALCAGGLTVVEDKGRRLLDNVDLVVRQGEVLAVVGPSGAGKSMLFRALTGAQPATTGRVVVRGRDLYAHYDELRYGIGAVPQDDVLHLKLKVRDVLRYAASLRFASDTTSGERESRVTEVLRDVGLVDQSEQRVETLSGGQRKRTSVALEMLTRPSLLFLDEPTSGLDPGNDKEVMQRLRELAAGGATVIVVTHSQLALKYCDQALFLAKGGRVAFLGPPDQAPGYFGQRELADVFRVLEHDPTRDWSAEFRRRDARPLPAPADRAEVGPAIAPAAGTVPRPDLRHQFAVLTRRYAAVVAADRRNLAILLAQAPLLGLLSRALVGEQGLTRAAAGPNVEARRLLLTLVLGGAWLGASNAVREIVKELPIYRRERGAGLAPSAYVASKVAVLTALTVAQSVVLVLVAVAGHDVPDEGTVLTTATGELVVDVAASGLAAMGLSLLLSALVTNTDKAVALLPLLVVPQLVLSGGLLALRDLPALDALSRVTPARWGYAAAASTTDLARLESPTPPGRRAAAHPDDRLWRHDARTWSLNLAALAALTAGSVAAAHLALRRREDTWRTGNRRWFRSRTSR